MIYTAKVIRVFKIIVSGPFIGADSASRHYIMAHMGVKGASLNIFDRAGAQNTVSFLQAQDNAFVATLPAGIIAALITANNRLINFYMTFKRVVVIGLSHKLSEFVSHAPRGFISASDLPLQFLGGYAVAGAGH